MGNYLFLLEINNTMDAPQFHKLRICPTTQQGGTQTIQQSIYLTHDNPCGANLLIFQEMGLSGIRYIDLKNYLDAIVSSEEMRLLFEDVRIAATNYIANPADAQLFYKYLYCIMKWSQRAIYNLPVSVAYYPPNFPEKQNYPPYFFRVDVYDGSGTEYYDSLYEGLEIVEYNSATGKYDLAKVDILPSQPKSNRTGWTNIYKLTSAPRNIPFIDDQTITGLAVLFSNFLYNQSSTEETEMAVASLLIDSANTRTFGIPKYGFSARQNISQYSGIVYNCVNFIDIRTMPDENGQTTLVESIFFRLSLNENTYKREVFPKYGYSIKTMDLPDIPLDEVTTEELVQNRDIMRILVRMIHEDTVNLDANLELMRRGQEKDVLLTYYKKLIGANDDEPELTATTENGQPQEESSTENI